MLYIVTPLSRIENLEKLKESFLNSQNFENNSQFVKWIIIYDKAICDKLASYVQLRHFFKLKDASCVKFSSPIANAFVGHAHRNHFFTKEWIMTYGNSPTVNNWVYFLDDDTLLHSDFLETILPLLESNSDKAAIIFDQENKDGSMRLFANINQVKVCHIDMGQYIVNLSKLPSDLRFKEDDYCADGIFIEELFNRLGPEQFLVVNKTLSTYNKLR